MRTRQPPLPAHQAVNKARYETRDTRDERIAAAAVRRYTQQCRSCPIAQTCRRLVYELCPALCEIPTETRAS